MFHRVTVHLQSVATLPIAALRSPNSKPLFLERMVRDARQINSPSLAVSTPSSSVTTPTTPSLPVIPKEKSKYADAEESYDDFEDSDKPVRSCSDRALQWPPLTSLDAQDTPLPRIATPQKSIEEDDDDADFQLEEQQVVR